MKYPLLSSYWPPAIIFVDFEVFAWSMYDVIRANARLSITADVNEVKSCTSPIFKVE